MNSSYDGASSVLTKARRFSFVNIKRWWQIDPNSTFKRRWDIAQAVILVYIAMVVPFRVGYKQPSEGLLYSLDLLIDLHFYIDLVFNFITGYDEEDEDEDVIIYDSWMIAKNYAKTWLTIDIVACLPIDMVLRIMDGTALCSVQLSGCPTKQDDASGGMGQLLRLFKLLRLFRLMKLLRLFKIMRLFERYQDDLFSYMHLLSVGKLIVILLYMGHIFGCVFHFFSVEDWRTPEENAQVVDGRLLPWLKQYFEDAQPTTGDVWDRYIASMYWAFTTMTTVGYGDISATTRCERVIACFGMIVGGFVFSGIIGTMSDVMANTDLSKKAHKHKMESVSSFIRESNLPREYMKELLAYFRNESVTGYNQQALLMDMPYHLRRKILYHRFQHIIHKVSLFDVGGDVGLDDHVFITELCSRLKQITYGSGQLIYQQGEIGHHMYILAIGRVEILDWSHEMVLAVLQPGAYFGEGCILGDVRRRENLRTEGMVELCRLEANDVEVLLDSYPHLNEALRDAYFKRRELFSRFESARAEDEELTLEKFMTQMRKKSEAMEPAEVEEASEGKPAEGRRIESNGGDASASAGAGVGGVAAGGATAGAAGVRAGLGPGAAAAGTHSTSGGSSGRRPHEGGGGEDGGARFGSGSEGESENEPAAAAPSRAILAHALSPSFPRSHRSSNVDPTLSVDLPTTMESVGEDSLVLTREGSTGKTGQVGATVKKMELQITSMAEKHVKLEAKLDEVMEAMKRMESLLTAGAAAKRY